MLIDVKIAEAEKRLESLCLKQREGEAVLQAAEMVLIEIRELKKLNDKYPGLINDNLDGDNKVIEEAIKDAETSNIEPIQFFSAVKKDNSGYICSARYDSYQSCLSEIGSDYRVAEFREVVPDGEYDWINLYSRTSDDAGSVFGYINESEKKAIEHRSDSLDFVDCVKIRRKK